jgi:hypothetical protein
MSNQLKNCIISVSTRKPVVIYRFKIALTLNRRTQVKSFSEYGDQKNIYCNVFPRLCGE